MGTLVRAIALGVLNQAVTSGTNFVLGALLVRQLTPEGFGAYGLGFSALLLAFNASEALFMTPGTVAIAQAPREEAASYAKTVLAGGTLIAAVLAIPVGLVSAVMFQSGGARSAPALAAVVTAGAFTFVAKEAFVRVCYALRREASALVVNVVFAAVVLGASTAQATRADGPVSALLYYAVAGALATVVGLLAFPALRAARLGSIQRVLAALFAEGRWYTAANLAYWLRSQAPVLAATWVLGLSSVGVLNAGRLLVTPPVLLNPSLGQIALPRLARIANERDGLARVTRGAWAVGLLLVGVSSAYCALLWFGVERVARLILGPSHAVPRALVASWCAFVIVLAARNGCEVALKALRRATHVLAANVVGAAVMVPLCVMAGRLFGVIGIVLGAALAEFTVIVVMCAAGMRARSVAPMCGVEGCDA